MTKDGNTHVSAYEILLVVFSLYVLLALLLERVVTLPASTLQILMIVDTLVCIIFFADFFVQLLTAKNKWHYLRWGWIDFLSSIPTLPILRWGRLVRIIRVLRVLRGIRASKILSSVIFAHRAKGALATATLLCLLLVVFGSVAILHVESEPASNIRTPGDAVWWSLATVATVGFGDKYPVTAEGRAIGVMLMIGGIGLFGTFTGYLATWFMEVEANPHDSVEKIAPELEALRVEVRELRNELKDLINHLETKHNED
jgi:voltage-gated potassium channel